MMTSGKYDLFLIDDDPINNMVNQKTLTKYKRDLLVKDFLEARKAITFLQESADNIPNIILLDINMPIMNGWQFLDAFVPLGIEASVFMLTSSIAKEDISKSETYACVKGFITKPLTEDKVKIILKNIA